MLRLGRGCDESNPWELTRAPPTAAPLQDIRLFVVKVMVCFQPEKESVTRMLEGNWTCSPGLMDQKLTVRVRRDLCAC